MPAGAKASAGVCLCVLKKGCTMVVRAMPFIRALVVFLIVSLIATGALAQCVTEQIMGPGAQGLDDFGRSIAIQDDRIVIGWTGGESFLEGAALVYRMTQTGPVLQTMLHSGVVNDGNRFGRAVDIDGQFIAVGDHFEQQTGAIYIYQMDGLFWSLDGHLPTPESQNFDGFGKRLALSNDLIVTSAVVDRNSFPTMGTAFVYRRQRGGWVMESQLDDPTSEQGEGFGSAVAARNDVVIVGAATHDGPATDTGAAFVYRYADGKWSFEAELKPSDAPACCDMWFGFSVALDAAGDTAIIGAVEDLSQLGSAYVYEYDGETWIEDAKLVADEDFGPWAHFGSSVALSDDGKTAIIGASADWEAGGNAGAAYIFRRINGHWTQVKKFLPGPGDAFLGASAALDGDYALAGAPDDNGTVYLYGGVQGVDCNDNGIADACDIHNGTSFDSDNDGIPNECDGVPDFDGDGHITVEDLLVLLKAWGTESADTNQDGVTDVTDLLALLGAWGPVNKPPDCSSSQESCCAVHDTPGCNDASCCESVCANDSFCCEVAWDNACVNAAQEVCDCSGPAQCGAGGDCCAFGGNDSAGCSDSSCCGLICEFVDPFCCDVQWDESCANWAFQLCDCPSFACNPDAGSCCEIDLSPTPGCEDFECCTLICAMDSFCCDVGWDPLCVEQAIKYCEVCGGDPPGR